jgi:hypothetical protein
MFMGSEPKEKKVTPKKKKVTPAKKKVTPAKKKVTPAKKKGAPVGNKYYLLRSKDGRDKKYPTPDDLWISCCEYFEYVEDNPLQEERAFSTKLGIAKVDLNKKRAMTLAGLRVSLGLSEAGYNHYREREEYKWVTNAVADIMYSQKFEGAAAGLLNPNIIARDLGLADKTELSGGVAVTKKNFNDFYGGDEEEGN